MYVNSCSFLVTFCLIRSFWYFCCDFVTLEHLKTKTHFYTAQPSNPIPSYLISAGPDGSSGTEPTGGSQWKPRLAWGALVRAQRTSLFLRPLRNPSQLYSKLCLLLLSPLRFLKRPQWPLGWWSLDMEAGRRRLKEQVVLLG